MTVAEAAEGVGATVILLNPDLSQRVTLGIHQKDTWASFVRSFENLYHFSNFFNLERPSRGPCGRRSFESIRGVADVLQSAASPLQRRRGVILTIRGVAATSYI